MSLPSHQSREPMDGYLRATLKNWASRVHPPSDGRARLLWEAATVRPEQKVDRVSLFFSLLRVEKYSQHPFDPTERLLHQARVNTLQFLFIGFH